MEVTINQQLITLNLQSTLAQALQDYGVSHAKGIAIAVNEAVIPQRQWDTTVLHPNDRIVIIKAAQGG